MTIFEESLKIHEALRGKVGSRNKYLVKNKHDLSLLYSPGVAEPSKRIMENEDLIYKYTSKGNTVVVITNGSAVLGLGNIGVKASLPVMEGKAMLLKSFANIDSFPICIDSKNPIEIVKSIKLISTTFGAINLEDFSAPDCFFIEKELEKSLDIPVFHDDQHGTAIVTVAALLNALKYVDKNINNAKIVINGAGSAGIAIAKHLKRFKVENIVMFDSIGAIYEGRQENMNDYKADISKTTNSFGFKGSLFEGLKNADVFIGVSKGGILSGDNIKSMNSNSIIFAMANPYPEIEPQEAIDAGAAIVGTGRSDYPNQVNNVLAFPGIFRGTLDSKAISINDEMKQAATISLAKLVDEKNLNKNYILPDIFDKRVVPTIAKAVGKAAKETDNVSKR